MEKNNTKLLENLEYLLLGGFMVFYAASTFRRTDDRRRAMTTARVSFAQSLPYSNPIFDQYDVYRVGDLCDI